MRDAAGDRPFPLAGTGIMVGLGRNDRRVSRLDGPNAFEIHELRFDYLPASPRLLYGLSNAGQLYAINGFTGVATAVGTASVDTPVLRANADIGIDFNPVGQPDPRVGARRPLIGSARVRIGSGCDNDARKFARHCTDQTLSPTLMHVLARPGEC